MAEGEDHAVAPHDNGAGGCLEAQAVHCSRLLAGQGLVLELDDVIQDIGQLEDLAGGRTAETE